jgi:hypothetical protein
MILRDVSEVLSDKEAQLERLGKEIDVLRQATEILSEETEGTSVYFDLVVGEAAEVVVPPGKERTDYGRKG